MTSSLLLSLITLFHTLLEADSTHWYASKGDKSPVKLNVELASEVVESFKFPGHGSIFLKKDRKRVFPSLSNFQKEALVLDVKVECDEKAPLAANLFLKTKDGFWFQSRENFTVEPGEWRTLRVELPAAAQELRAVGHNAKWRSDYLSQLQTIGISFYDRKNREVKVHCKNIALTGKRDRPKLYVRDWTLAANTECHQMLESFFKLSREYFNPFDPNEIKVDFEIQDPNGEIKRWPAYYTRSFSRKIRYDKESISPIGEAYWAFRYTPRETGDYKVRLIVEDNSGERTKILETPWREFSSTSSNRTGFVRVSEKDHRYFELTTGEFFFPTGFNIHTVKDLRSEKRLKLGHIPDRGTYSYDNYFAKMEENGANAAEVWMASWSTALEWTSEYFGYYGMGRYNLMNAWKLDHIMKSALKHGIYIHFVLDNHGKLSSGYDDEWTKSPHNAKNDFALTNLAMLTEPKEFFTNPRALEFYKRRNRYIAARWGAFTNIFGVEFWSEIDLVTGHSKLYKDGTSEKWHSEMAKHWLENDQGEHLLTTHFCGDYKKEVSHKRLFQLPEINYVVGDAYRAHKIPFVNYMRRHTKALRFFKKPMLITEFGGSSRAGTASLIQADLHSGIWSSFFREQAGTPFLWWHEFINKMDHYKHFKGFSKFFKGVDPRGKDYVYDELVVYESKTAVAPYIKPQKSAIVLFENSLLPFETLDNLELWRIMTLLSAKKAPVVSEYTKIPFDSPRRLDTGEVNSKVAGLIAGDENELFAWIFSIDEMFKYPKEIETLPLIEDQYFFIQNPILKGKYRVEFYDTISGEKIGDDTISVESTPAKIIIPPFKLDIAIKMFREE